MRKYIFLAAAAMALAGCSGNDKGSVTITLPEGSTATELVVSYMTIENSITATSAEDLRVVYDTLQVKDGKASMKLASAEAARYDIMPPVPARSDPEFYASPGENLHVIIRSFEPLDYSVEGTRLMEDITAMRAASRPMQDEYVALLTSGADITPDQVYDIMNRYSDAIKKFVAENPESPAVPLAIMELSADDFKPIYDNMTPQARASILMPYAEVLNREVEKDLAERQAEADRRAEVASGTITAPGFTLPDLAGKQVSLADFRGKWVVLDFWGSWCGWCVKGFPALKEAYAKYGDRITIIGIDCNESEADWRAGVKKYELPWLNLYNGNNRDLYTAYNIEGFPTKAIINPEGKLVAVTTGEDPSFFTRLAKFLE